VIQQAVLTAFANADLERTGTEEVELANGFGMMVAREGVDPPTPAFSGILSA
jgi:hypothetical protein